MHQSARATPVDLWSTAPRDRKCAHEEPVQGCGFYCQLRFGNTEKYGKICDTRISKSIEVAIGPLKRQENPPKQAQANNSRVTDDVPIAGIKCLQPRDLYP